LIIANLLALLVLLVVLLVGWWEEAAFGLAVLLVLDLLVVLRTRQARADRDSETQRRQHREDGVDGEWPEITYDQARAAYEAGQKLHEHDRVYLVRRALRGPEAGLVLWVTDERSLGDHGVLLFPDGRMEVK
jgi:hypothetical protein